MADIQEIQERIGARLKELRDREGWTQAEVARRARVSRDFVGRAERGLRQPSIYVLTKLADVFNVDPVFFLTPVDDSPGASMKAIEGLLQGRPVDDLDWIRGLLQDLLHHIDSRDKPLNRGRGRSPQRKSGRKAKGA